MRSFWRRLTAGCLAALLLPVNAFALGSEPASEEGSPIPVQALADPGDSNPGESNPEENAGPMRRKARKARAVERDIFAEHNAELEAMEKELDNLLSETEGVKLEPAINYAEIIGDDVPEVQDDEETEAEEETVVTVEEQSVTEPEKTSGVPVEEETKTEEDSKAPVEEETETKTEEDSKAPVEEETENKTEEDSKAPVEEETENKTEEDSKAPVEEETETKTEEDSKAPSEEESNGGTEDESEASDDSASVTDNGDSSETNSGDTNEPDTGSSSGEGGEASDVADNSADTSDPVAFLPRSRAATKAEPYVKTDSSTITAFYANGVPIEIKFKADGTTTCVSYDYYGDTAEVTVTEDTVIYGGSENDDVEDTWVKFTAGNVGSVFGGGKSGDVTGTASVTVNGEVEATAIYGGGETGAVNETVVKISGSVPTDAQYVIPVVYGGGKSGTTTSASVTVDGNAVGTLFGGGHQNGATVDSTYVNITGGKVEWVYGGGHGAQVTGEAKVEVSGGTDFKCIYGGGNISNGSTINASTGSTSVSLNGITTQYAFGGGAQGPIEDSVNMTLNGVTVSTCVYGGGQSGAVQNDVTVTAKGATTSPALYGGGYEGTVKNTHVKINTTGTINYVYGGGYTTLGSPTTTNTNVTLDAGTVDNLYGGGYQAGVSNLASVTINGGTVNKSVYGGGVTDTNSVVANTSVTIAGGSVKWAYGGGYKGSVSGATDVHVTGGTIGQNVFGGGHTGGVTGTAKLTVSGGTIGNGTAGGAFGGGENGTVGTTQVVIETDGTIPVVAGGGKKGNATNTSVTVKNGKILTMYGGNYTTSSSGATSINVAITGTGKEFQGHVKQLNCGDRWTGATTDLPAATTGSANVTFNMSGGYVEDMFTGYYSGTPNYTISGGHIVHKNFGATPAFKNGGVTVFPAKLVLQKNTPTVSADTSDLTNGAFSGDAKAKGVRVTVDGGTTWYSKLSTSGELTVYLPKENAGLAKGKFVVAIDGVATYANTGNTGIIDGELNAFYVGTATDLSETGEKFIVTFGPKDAGTGSVTASGLTGGRGSVTKNTVVTFAGNAQDDGTDKYKLVGWLVNGKFYPIPDRDGSGDIKLYANGKLDVKITGDTDVKAQFNPPNSVTIAVNILDGSNPTAAENYLSATEGEFSSSIGQIHTGETPLKNGDAVRKFQEGTSLKFKYTSTNDEYRVLRWLVNGKEKTATGGVLTETVGSDTLTVTAECVHIQPLRNVLTDAYVMYTDSNDDGVKDTAPTADDNYGKDLPSGTYWATTADQSTLTAAVGNAKAITDNISNIPEQQVIDNAKNALKEAMKLVHLNYGIEVGKLVSDTTGIATGNIIKKFADNTAIVKLEAGETIKVLAEKAPAEQVHTGAYEGFPLKVNVTPKAGYSVTKVKYLDKSTIDGTPDYTELTHTSVTGATDNSVTASLSMPATDVIVIAEFGAQTFNINPIKLTPADTTGTLTFADGAPTTAACGSEIEVPIKITMIDESKEPDLTKLKVVYSQADGTEIPESTDGHGEVTLAAGAIDPSANSTIAEPTLEGGKPVYTYKVKFTMPASHVAIKVDYKDIVRTIKTKKVVKNASGELVDTTGEGTITIAEASGETGDIDNTDGMKAKKGLKFDITATGGQKDVTVEGSTVKKNYKLKSLKYGPVDAEGNLIGASATVIDIATDMNDNGKWVGNGASDATPGKWVDERTTAALTTPSVAAKTPVTMPGTDIIIVAEFEEITKYSVQQLSTSENVTLKFTDETGAEQSEFAAGDTVKVKVTPKSGFNYNPTDDAHKLKFNITGYPTTGTDTITTLNTSSWTLESMFTMPAANVTVGLTVDVDKVISGPGSAGDDNNEDDTNQGGSTQTPPTNSTVTYTTSSSSSRSSTRSAALAAPASKGPTVSNGTDGTVTAAVATTTPDAAGTVHASVNLDASTINTAVTNAVAANPGAPVVTLNATVNADAGTQTAATYTMPKASVADMSEKGIAALNASTPEGTTITLDAGSLDTVSKTEGKGTSDNVSIKIEPVTSATTLSDEAKTSLSGRPAYSFKVLVGNTPVRNFDGTLTLSIPYELEEGETADRVAACYIDDNGNVEILEGSTYKDGKVVFTTNHLSMYGVTYIEMISKFLDIAEHWARKSIIAMEEKGLVNGITETEFMPNLQLGRGMLITILGRMAGADSETVADTGFTDVSKDAYYAPYAAWAKANGLAQGVGNDEFAPDAPVTREQLAVLLYRYAKLQDTDIQETADSVPFADDETISPWAEKAVYALRDASIIEGMGDNTYSPREGATRAQVCAILQRFIDLVEA